MTDESHADTLATAVANISNIAKSVDYLVQRSDASALQHTEVISKLAVISSKQDDTKAYQDKCDVERRDHDKRISAAETTITELNKRMDKMEELDLDRRTTKVEGFQNTQLKVAGTAGGFIALIVTGAIEWIKK
jgi:hypothetical protein